MKRFGMTRTMGRSPFHRAPANYKVNAQEGEILLYDEIGFWGITAEEFVRDLEAVKTDEVLVRINSPGGEVGYVFQAHARCLLHALDRRNYSSPPRGKLV